jgi:diguanylate cyclase (GGDEF)-like protein
MSGELPPNAATILVVDDNAANRELVSTLLKYRGHRVHEAGDGFEGLQKAVAVRPRLVISDILMPTMDGFEFVRQLRAIPDLASIDVIFYTAHYHAREAAKLAAACGVARVLIKPCEPEEILNTVAEVLRAVPAAAHRPTIDADFDRDHVALMTNTLAQKVDELSVSNSRLKALTELNLQLASERDPRRLLDTVCYSARNLIGAKFAVLVVTEKKSRDALLCSTSGLDMLVTQPPALPPRLDFGPLGRVFSDRASWRVRSQPAEPLAGVLPAGFPTAQAYLAVPIASLTHTYGWLCLADKLGAEEFDLEDERNLLSLAGQVGRIYENGSLYQEVQQHAAQLRIEMDEREQSAKKIQHLNRVYAVLSGINTLIIRTQTQAELFTEACRLAVEHGRFQLACIGWLDDAADRITPLAWAGDAAITRLINDNVSLLVDARAVESLRARQPWVCNDIEAEARLDYRQVMIDSGLRSVVTLPLVMHERTVACLVLATVERGSFDAAEMRLLDELAGDISFALDHIEKSEKLNYLAYYDSQTGLANRALFLERLAQHVAVAKHNGGEFAVTIRDPQRFDTINQSFGRTQGDVLLKEIVDRLIGCVGDSSSLARIAPGQFASVITVDDGADGVARALDEQNREWLATAFPVGTDGVMITARVGVALYPHDGHDAESLLRNAEAALKRAKSGGEPVVFFTQEISDRITERVSLERRLHRALENNEFVLHYQPKVDLETRRLEGVEALIRWQSPEFGLLGPQTFIPFTEENGMIVEVGGWVLRQACADRCAWLEKGLKAHRLAVNISTVQLRRPDFVSVVRNAVKLATRNAVMFGAAQAGIDIEVTESLFVENAAANMRKLQEIRDLGIGIAIDDFGTGYSSLGYLSKMPLDSLKIDYSFTAAMMEDPSVMTLVSTMITLAHALKLKVIVEGVESEEQAKILRLLRADQMQGFLISKALPFERITELLGQSSGEARPFTC